MQNTPSASATLVTYQPQLLVAAAAPHSAQRQPRDHHNVGSADTNTPCRTVEVFRFAGRSSAKLSIDDMECRFTISLSAANLRRLAFQLLDAAHDIEHAHTELEQAA